MPDEATLLIEHAAELVTVAGPRGPRRGPAQAELGILRDGALAAGADSRILAVGTTGEVRAAVALAPGARVIDATGRTVLPGFVDPHTHAVFAGDRVEEFARRLQGADYLEILAAGGGILSTVRATRAASQEELEQRTRGYLEEMLRHGTTTLEIKSGYGLSVEDELKMLRVIQALEGQGARHKAEGTRGEREARSEKRAGLRSQHPGLRTQDSELSTQNAEPRTQNSELSTRHSALPSVVPTFLGAHAVPPEYRDRSDGYVDLVVDEMIPRVAAEGLARFCDVFCERGAFSLEQGRRVLEAGRAHGLAPKIHADQKTALGGALLAAEVGAVSADHLEHATEEGIEALARAGTVAVLLPGAAFVLIEEVQAPARRLVERGVPVALATDFNPGTCPILSMPLILGLACLRRLLSPAEAIVAATQNAACALGLGDEVGSLEPGKRADAVILDAPSHLHLVYWFGRNLVRTVVKDGRVAWTAPES